MACFVHNIISLGGLGTTVRCIYEPRGCSCNLYWIGITLGVRKMDLMDNWIAQQNKAADYKSKIALGRKYRHSEQRFDGHLVDVNDASTSPNGRP